MAHNSIFSKFSTSTWQTLIKVITFTTTKNICPSLKCKCDFNLESFGLIRACLNTKFLQTRHSFHYAMYCQFPENKSINIIP